MKGHPHQFCLHTACLCCMPWAACSCTHLVAAADTRGILLLSSPARTECHLLSLAPAEDTRSSAVTVVASCCSCRCCSRCCSCCCSSSRRWRALSTCRTSATSDDVAE